jgi:cell division transport system permease protein
MRGVSVRYLIKDGFKNIKSNWTMSLSSVVVLMSCLFLIGAIVLFSMSINKTLAELEGNSSATVYLDMDMDEAAAREIGAQIGALSNVKECLFISKEETIKKYQKDLPELEELLGEDNPMPHSCLLKVADLSKYSETEESINSIEGVDSISNYGDYAQKFTEFNKMISYVEVVVIAVFGLIALFIGSNTIRVAMFSRRQEIGIMKSVGATNLFIRIPFIVEGIVIGLISALGAIGLLQLASEFLATTLQKLAPTITNFEGIDLNMGLIFALAGMAAGLIGGVFSVSRYLRKAGGEVFV